MQISITITCDSLEEAAQITRMLSESEPRPARFQNEDIQSPGQCDLRELREAKGLTQQELANRSGITMSTISNIETGNANPRPLTWRKIYAGLNGLHSS